MGEKQNQPFQPSFNTSLKIDFQGSRVTSDGGLIVVREFDERLGLGELIAQHLADSRRAKNTQFPLADLLRQSIYRRMAGYEDVNDAERLSQDPTFRLIGSEKIWERGAALTSRLQSFETEMLAEEENFVGLATINRESIAKAEAIDSLQRVVLDMDSTEIPVYGQQEQSAYKGHFESTCYHPLLLFNRGGDCLAAKLRPGNVHSAEDWEELLLPEVEAAFKMKSDLRIRPTHHQLEHRAEAHILVAFLAYSLHVTLKNRVQAHAPGLTPKAALEKLADIQMLDVWLPTTDGRWLILPRYTQPEPDQALLLHKLRLACLHNRRRESGSARLILRWRS
jgi:hypothetical protein